jgi:hypothetical protein
VLRRGESWDGWLAAVWEGRGGMGVMGKKKGKKKEKQRKRVSAKSVYTGFYRWNHRRTRSVGITVGDSADGSATSLYGYPDLNPSVISSVKSSEKIHVITSLQLKKKVSQPSMIWSVYTDGLISSVYNDHITNRIYRSVNTDKF